MKQSSRKHEEDSPGLAAPGRAICEAIVGGGGQGGGRLRAPRAAPERVEVSKLARISEDQGSRMEAVGGLVRI